MAGSAAEQLALLARIHEDYPPMPVVSHRVFGRAPGTPTLLRELTTTDVEGRPFELSFTYFRTGRAALSGIGTFTESGYGVL
ncbi:hypothetical protein [Pseudonocardia oroxyli]|uniref:UTRA domain-containing protein n=1 Tax=Pseudonocardia oroxyli TaxID=366584 RepID=A0A1G7EHI3_PSEOR|nr:hypothetical protein [Pseudonocardia oroxyli]SDE63132.1 hypothetical protein SAMN05216377_101379 [Pseudonocardia oroxyli]